ncbi:MAG: hypothetical protein OEV30_03115, partial [Ignavibacteria bacterium]|nr:hypothetical protein [Ignavibacteria bacterium]
MKLFRKHLHPETIGSMVYELLRSEMERNGDLSFVSLLDSLDLQQETLHSQYRGDIIVGLMFGAVMAIERSTGTTTAQQIISGMKNDFLAHLEEQGASVLQRAEWEATVAGSFLLYRQALEDYSGFEPPWKVGRQFYWNLIGREQHVAMSVKISTLYLVAAQEKVQAL